ncbi:Uncharacterised protein [uncultured archaeon]|nr:Uncharacterised protein [uncultured archaeon]
MSRIEIITITNGRNKSEKDMLEFLVKEFVTIKNLMFLIVSIYFILSAAWTDSKSSMKWSMPGLSVLIEVFL